MNLIKPKKLQKGDTIALVSISGNIREPQNIERAKKYFESKGFNVIISENTYKNYRYHAGNDEERANTFNEYVKNKDIDAIVCTRGGYGVLRIIDKIDYKAAACNPKIICGYSDITVLLLMLLKRSNIVTFHGAMANGDFGKENISKITEKSFFETLYGETPLIFKTSNVPLYSGEAEGILWGGNLATITSMVGVDFIPDEKFIFFTEDIGEPDYKIDRMFTQLFNTEKFKKNIQGMVIGEFTNSEKQIYTKEVIKEYAKEYKIPCSDGFYISHGADKYTLPVGCKCKFNTDDRTVKIVDTPFAD